MTRKKCFLLIYVLALFFYSAKTTQAAVKNIAPADSPLYVLSTATGFADGETWETAYSSIQAAIEDPKSETRPIFVAEGLYEERVFMKTDRKVYGGFQAGDTELNDRDQTSTKTIISVFVFASPKSAVTFSGIQNSMLSGFLLTSSDDGTPMQGQAIDIKQSSAILVSKCWIEGSETPIQINDSNVSIEESYFTSNKFSCIDALDSTVNMSNLHFQTNLGEGILVRNCNGEITDCFFKDGLGSAIQLDDFSSFLISNCTIEKYDRGVGTFRADATILNTIIKNSVSISIFAKENCELFIQGCKVLNGASTAIVLGWQCRVYMDSCEIKNNLRNNSPVARVNSRATLTFDMCVIENNQSTNGEILSVTDSNIILKNSIVRNNHAVGPRGMIYVNQSTCEISDSDLSENSTSSKGGALNLSNSTCIISNSLFSENSAEEDGGVIYNEFSECEIINCTFNDNDTSGLGGVIYSGNISPANMVNCIVSQHESLALYELDFFSDFSLQNCLFYNNSGGDLRDHDTNLIYTGAADINSFASGGTISANRTGNPQFVDSASGDYRLRLISPAIDNGTAQGAPSTDLLGNFRPFRVYPSRISGYDIGAYEFMPEVMKSNYWLTW